MCIICFIPKKSTRIPNKKQLKNCFLNNPDGAGVMYQEGRNVFINKGFMTFKEFYRFYDKLPVTAGDIALHFRISTAGKINQFCTHPFPIDGTSIKGLSGVCKRAMMHNGVIHEKTVKDSALSDTMHLARELVDIHPSRIAYEPYLKGEYGRFVVMTAKESYLYGRWIYDDGVYWSNSTYEYEIWPVKYTNYKDGFWDSYYKGGKSAGDPDNFTIKPKTAGTSHIVSVTTIGEKVIPDRTIHVIQKDGTEKELLVSSSAPAWKKENIPQLPAARVNMSSEIEEYTKEVLRGNKEKNHSLTTEEKKEILREINEYSQLNEYGNLFCPGC